jgi:DNA-3-methyladenine glycosylase II
MIKWNTEEAYKILKKDPVMKKVISSTGEIKPVKRTDIYFSLLNSIASQQLSVKAADTIFNRFLDLFPERKPEAALVTKINIEKLRNAGLSYAKAGYLKNIADYNITHGLEYKKLNRMDDEQLLEYLTAIKGVGRWTGEMILMFTMNRPDVLPVDDLGIRTGIQRLYGLTGTGKKLTEEIVEVAQKWKPYRTLACRHVWRYRDATLKALKK